MKGKSPHIESVWAFVLVSAANLVGSKLCHDPSAAHEACSGRDD
jgi:hypothetical protein